RAARHHVNDRTETEMTTTELNPERVEEFAGRMVGVLNDALLALTVSLGHQSGLFDTMATMPAATSHDIANAAGLQERYVREALGALTTGRIVSYDPDAHAYALPAEHAAVLTRAAGADNIAALTQFIAMLGGVEQDVLRCFREGGGVPYSHYPTFHRLMAELTKDTVDATLLDATVALVPGLRDDLERGIDVADIGCGAGYALTVLAAAFPKSRFTGYDFSEEAIAAARATAMDAGLDNVRFEVRDAARLDVVEAFDLVTTFDAIHDQAAPDAVLSAIARSLRSNGVYLCVDVAASSRLEENLDHPLGPTIYTISTMHCMTVSLALDGAGLGAAWGEQTAHDMLRAAGFEDITTERVEGDVFNVYYVARKTPA
ncbi:MAG TPA: methyltransferase domain-containing protein, partial [Acidimicrobiales bacterium]